MKILIENGYNLDILRLTFILKLHNKLILYGLEKCPSFCDYLALVRRTQDLPGKTLKVCAQLYFSC